MTTFNTFKLKNIDPEDISDVLLKVEKSFDIEFGKTELINVKTFGELSDIITSKIQGNNMVGCTTQQAFYKIRNAIAEVLIIDKNGITPDANLKQLFPKIARRKKTASVEKILNFKTGILRPKYWVTGTLVFMVIGSIAGLFFFWKTALIILLLSIIAFRLAERLGKEFNIQTVGEWAEKISREQYIKARRNPNTINKAEVARKVKELFLNDLVLEESELSKESTFN